MADVENGSNAVEAEDRDIPSPVVPRKKEPSDQFSAWMLAGWMVLAPLLMLITIWVLTIFRKH